MLVQWPTMQMFHSKLQDYKKKTEKSWTFKMLVQPLTRQTFYL